MSRKNKQKNGFFYYMLDMKEELRRQGRNVPMSQLSAIAGPKWSRLPEARKAEYNLRAKHEKRAGHPVDESTLLSRPGRMDSAGELLSERRDPVAEKLEKRRKQKEFLQEILPVTKDIVLMKFYILDIQPLCELKHLENDRYLPCELALVEYSLAHGMENMIHYFIDPGPIPMGFRYEAQRQSDQTHNLPVSEFELATRDYRKILSNLQSMTSSSRIGGSPIIFALQDSVDKIEYQLHWMANKAGLDLFVSEIYELELLMMGLDSVANALYPPPPPPPGVGGATAPTPILSEYQATMMLSTTAYNYESDTKCDWHGQREVLHCSLAVVNICRYVFSDHLCPKFHVSITTNHLPEKTLPVLTTSFQNTKISDDASSISKPKPRGVSGTYTKVSATEPSVTSHSIRIRSGGRGRGSILLGDSMTGPPPPPSSYGRGRFN